MPSNVPLRYALALALGYAAVGAAWIVLSTQLAASGAATVDALEDAEITKGLAYVGVTGLLFFGVSYWLFRRLAAADNELMRRQQELVVAQRRATAGLLTASIAHDFNNLLTVIQGSLAALDEKTTDAELRELLEDAEEASRQGAQLAQRLAAASRDSSHPTKVPLDLARAARGVVRLLRVHEQVRGVDLEVRPSRAPTVPADIVLVDQIVTNLVLNAARAAGPDGRVEVRIVDAASAVALEVHDSGAGIPETERERVFDAFFTQSAGGMGLGLLSVKLGAAAQGGAVEVADSDLGGACLRVTFPHEGRPAEPPSLLPDADAPPRARGA